MNLLKVSILIVFVTILTGCARNISLNAPEAKQIKTTKLFIVKKQDTLKLEKNYPGIVFFPNAATIPVMIIGTSSLHLINVLVFEKRKQTEFEPIIKDLKNYSFEDITANYLQNIIQKNQHFNFTSAEVVNIKNDKDLPKLLHSSDAEHVAFLIPSYTLGQSMNIIKITWKLSIYHKNAQSKRKSKLPSPIYQTNLKYEYKLPNSRILAYAKNAKRWKENDSKLLITTFNEGITKLSSDLLAKLEQPFAKKWLT